MLALVLELALSLEMGNLYRPSGALMNFLAFWLGVTAGWCCSRAAYAEYEGPERVPPYQQSRPTMPADIYISKCVQGMIDFTILRKTSQDLSRT